MLPSLKSRRKRDPPTMCLSP